MVQIYTHKDTVRLQYILEFIFEEYEVVTDINLLNAGTILNYSNEEISSNMQVVPSGLLEHESVVQDYHSGYQHNDMLSNIFFVLTRYEEYLIENTDKFGRFSAVFSEQYKSNHLEEPIVDQWVFDLKEKLKVPNNTEVKFIPTFDIDNAWAYKNKGTIRAIASKAKDIVNKDKARLKERKEVLKGSKIDPYDTFDFIESLKGLKPKVFFLLGDYGKYDRNINWTNTEFQELIKKVGGFAEVGIHPSFDSFENPSKMKLEKERLETILDKEVTISRQHFLRFRLPDTYQQLESIGIKEDYSMGFAQHFGWRAGTSKSFYFFDLLHNRKSNLRIFPFQYMDGTLNEYLNLEVEKAKEVVKNLVEQTNKYGGNFIPLWHNETIGSYGIWKGWNEVLNYNISLYEK